MKHNWHDTTKGLVSSPERTCRNCGKSQTQYEQTAWGRIISRRWEPLVGRCEGKPTIKRSEVYREALNEQVRIFVDGDGTHFLCKWIHADSLKCGKCLTGQLIGTDSGVRDNCRVCGAQVLVRSRAS